MARIWRAIKSFLVSQMGANIVGALIVSTLLPAVYQWFTEPPGIETVTILMHDEARSAKAQDANVVRRIFAPDGVVTDAACQTRGVSQTWTGYKEIYDRYKNLPKFVSIQHLNTHVSWEPNNSHASTASVTAETIGVIEASPRRPKRESIVGHELWTFSLVGGHWRVTSFTYNLCLPQSSGA